MRSIQDKYNEIIESFREVFNKQNKTKTDFAKLDEFFDELANLKYLDLVEQGLLEEKDFYFWEKLLYIYEEMLLKYEKNHKTINTGFIKKLIRGDIKDYKRIFEIVNMFFAWEPVYIKGLKEELLLIKEIYWNDKEIMVRINRMLNEIEDIEDKSNN